MNLKDFNQKLDSICSHLRSGVQTSTRDYEWRVSQLKALRSLILENEEALNSAMWADLRKSKFECSATEQGVVLSEISDALKNLKRWMKPESVHSPLYNFPGRCEIIYEPLGLALIIGAWNYPINLLLAPLVAAIAGGNGALLKPSEMAAHTADVIGRLIPEYMDKNLIAILPGGPDQTDAVLDRKFDTIFFTGSGHVGKIVMTKAAQHLTPVTLELGGKSPAFVLEDADIEVTARRLTWGKFMNAGQTCVCPDYIMVQPQVKQKLIDAIQKNLRLAYGENPRLSPDYCRIVNKKNFQRLDEILKKEKVLLGGEADAEQLYIAPTLTEATFASASMQDELFGPIFPIVEVETLEAMVHHVLSKPKPLSLYIFSESKSIQDKVIRETSSGGVCVNDVVMQMPVATLPFGGVGASGMGHYHGKFGFRTFTHAKGILRKGTWLDIRVRYAPYTIRNMKILRWLFS